MIGLVVPLFLKAAVPTCAAIGGVWIWAWKKDVTLGHISNEVHDFVTVFTDKDHRPKHLRDQFPCEWCDEEYNYTCYKHRGDDDDYW